jgi:hypothetical protein
VLGTATLEHLLSPRQVARPDGAAELWFFRATVSGDRLGYIRRREQGTVVLDGCGAGVFP